MLRVAFVLPCDTQNFKPFRNQPLTSLYLLTILEERFGDRLDLSLIDLRGVREENISYYLPEMDIYLYTATSLEYHSICEVRDLLRSMYPKALHVVGGPHINLFPKSSKGFDSIVLGEGEEIVVRMIEDIFNGDLKPIYDNTKKIVDLNQYPYPFRKYLPLRAVVDTGLLHGDNGHLPGTTVLFSRGCPFQCAFCANVNLGPTRYRAPELVEQEIEYLKMEYGVKAIALKDDNAIPLAKKFAKPFLSAIGRTGVKWRGQSRANGVSEELVKLAAEAGCTDIGIGIESVCTKVLEIINKRIDLEQAKEYIKILQHYRIGVRLHLILGLPGEPEDIVSRTLEFINETEPASVLLSLFTPVPGSVIANSPKKFGIRNVNPNWHEHRVVFGRFDEQEIPQTLFEYDDVTPWGKAMSRERILNNYRELQAILRERNLNF